MSGLHRILILLLIIGPLPSFAPAVAESDI
jgi:hypothetical protein